jgi:hypothetical protein
MAFLESLESRLFLSVTPAQSSAAVKVIRTELATVNADLKQLKKQLNADIAIIMADIKRLKATRTEHALTLTLSRAAHTFVSLLQTGENAGAASVNRDANRLVAAERSLAKKPALASLQQKANNAATLLTNDATTAVTKLSIDASTITIDNVLTSIATANSTGTKTITDVATTRNDINNTLSPTGQNAIQAYKTDVAALVNLYSA